ncbi:MAG: adenylyltransferase/cytidyltransferase family protein [Patescibacteria group bacterium]
MVTQKKIKNKKAKKAQKAIFFGTFDGIHEGHLRALREARCYAERLFVVIPQDFVVRRLKGHPPERNAHARARALRRTSIPHAVYLGDKEIGSYEIIRRIDPDLICFGYDQKDLRSDILKKMKERVLPLVSLKVLRPHLPKEFHTSILRKGDSKRK